MLNHSKSFQQILCIWPRHHGLPHCTGLSPEGNRIRHRLFQWGDFNGDATEVGVGRVSERNETLRHPDTSNTGQPLPHIRLKGQREEWVNPSDTGSHEWALLRGSYSHGEKLLWPEMWPQSKKGSKSKFSRFFSLLPLPSPEVPLTGPRPSPASASKGCRSQGSVSRKMTRRGEAENNHWTYPIPHCLIIKH